MKFIIIVCCSVLTLCASCREVPRQIVWVEKKLKSIRAEIIKNEGKYVKSNDVEIFFEGKMSEFVMLHQGWDKEFSEGRSLIESYQHHSRKINKKKYEKSNRKDLWFLGEDEKDKIVRLYLYPHKKKKDPISSVIVVYDNDGNVNFYSFCRTFLPELIDRAE